MVRNDSARLLAVMAHPDDAELWLGGTLAIHASMGGAFILVASGEAERSREARAGASVLGCKIHVVEQHTEEILTEIGSLFKPDIIVTHHFDDCHHEHRRTSEMVLAAMPHLVINHGFPSRLFFCDTYNSLLRRGSFPGTTIVDVTSTFALKIKALQRHKSQPLNRFVPMAKQIGALWGARVGATWGEAFTPCPILGNIPCVSHL